MHHFRWKDLYDYTPLCPPLCRSFTTSMLLDDLLPSLQNSLVAYLGNKSEILYILFKGRVHKIWSWTYFMWPFYCIKEKHSKNWRNYFLKIVGVMQVTGPGAWHGGLVTLRSTPYLGPKSLIYKRGSHNPTITKHLPSVVRLYYNDF